jgi:hypothetical protein
MTGSLGTIVGLALPVVTGEYTFNSRVHAADMAVVSVRDLQCPETAEDRRKRTVYLSTKRTPLKSSAHSVR